MIKNNNTKIHNSAFIADGAKIIGNVTIKEDASVWYNAVIRADLGNTEISIGERTNIQDGTVVHIEHNKSVIIGNDVTIGHNCTIHACTIEDGCLIGMGATILTGAHVKKGAIVGAASLVKENMVIEEKTLVVGIPAKSIRKISDETYEDNIQHATNYAGYAKEHKKKLEIGE